MEDKPDTKDRTEFPHSLFAEESTPSERSNAPPATFSEEWWTMGADSAEHYQQILLDSTRFNNSWTGSNLTVNAQNTTVTRDTGGEIGLNEAAILANADSRTESNTRPVQILPVRSRPIYIDPNNPTVTGLPYDLPDSDTDESEVNEPITTPIRSPPQLIQQESFEEIQLRLTNEFVPIVEYDWDTLIWIGPPAQEHDQDDDEYNYIKRHFSKPYLMNSATLRKAGSPELAKLLGPKSARAQRSLRKLDLHRQLPGNREPKYYIDLRPPQDGDAAVEMVTEMSCTPGVLSWYKQATRLGVDKAVVCGTDSLNIVGRRSVESSAGTVQQEPEEEPAYSSLRHHLAIERLLQTIAGESPRLNSAPKLWTFVAIAKYLGCAKHSSVISEVYSWLFADRNSNFIQNNPEVTYRIARNLQLADLTRVSYALLVGEKALLQRQLSTSVNSAMPNRQVELRPLCNLDEDEVNRIDHAARSFGSRIQLVFLKMVNEPMPWMIGSTEVLKLIALKATEPASQMKLTSAWKMLREYVRDRVFRVLTKNFSTEYFFDKTKIRDRLTSQRRCLINFEAATYTKNSVPQRLLTRAFWEYLKVIQLDRDGSRDAAWINAHTTDGLEELVPEYIGKSSIPLPERVQELDIINALDEINTFVDERDLYYPAIESSTTGRVWPSVLRSHLYASAHANLLCEAEEHSEATGKTIRDSITSEDELVQTLQLLNMKKLSCVPLASEPIVGTRAQPKLVAGKSPGLVRLFAENRINFDNLFSELETELALHIEKQTLTPGWANDELGVENEVPIGAVESLVGLGDGEWKYLPLWAGGLDDGTGGVFAAENVPDMEVGEGFRGGSLGLGNSLDDLADVEMGEDGYSMVDGSEFEDVATEDGVSTVGKASRVVTVGTRSTANTVISMEE